MEIITITVDINIVENRKTIEDICETKSQFFKEFNKIDKPLARLTKKKRKTLITKIRSERQNIATDLKKQKGLKGNIINNCIPTHWKNQLQWINFQKHSFSN